jgi:hypothetical protein
MTEQGGEFCLSLSYEDKTIPMLVGFADHSYVFVWRTDENDSCRSR